MRCEKCGHRRNERTSESRWASVVTDETNSVPRILCPRCADKFESGWDEEIDPVTKQVRRFQRDFAATLQRF